ncbi:TIGR03617 family F420-dependent LLM class oxidoreductase [Dehalococcoidia bacterium]|nr:TIGR03617 family F420-dependent LLM class oxidoreductase [Dehalococcoidia bacterium]
MKAIAQATDTSLKQIPEAARRAERLGYHAMNNGERRNHAFLPPLLAAEHTERLMVSPNVAIAFARSPMATAYASWNIQAFSDGRFQLGLGTQIKAHITRRFGAEWGKPAARMRDYILALRAIFDCWQNETKLDYQGAFYKLNLMIPYFNPGPIAHPNIPIHIAAVGPRMARMAGEVCDGLGWHGFHTAKYLREVVFENFKLGAQASGRDISRLRFEGLAHIATGATDEEVEKGRLKVRNAISFYGSTPAYHPVLEIHGWNDLGEKLHLMSRDQKWEQMATEIPDEVVDEIAVTAKYDDLAKAIKQRYEDFATGFSIDLPTKTPEEEERLASIIKEIQA